MVPWDTVSPHQGCPGKQPKQSNYHYPYSRARESLRAAQTRSSNICHRARTTAALSLRVLGMACRGGHTAKRGFWALLGLAQAVNNGTKPRILPLPWKWAVTHFAARPCLGCFYCFPNNHFYCKSQITKAQRMLLPGWKWEQGLEARTEEEKQWECIHSPVGVLQSSPLEASQLCQPCLSLHQSCQLD